MQSVSLFTNDTQSRRVGTSFNARVLTTVSALALAAFAAPHAARAAEANQPAQAQSSEQSAQSGLEEIVITGSRIIREGYQAPTPLTVVDTTALEATPNSNMAEFLNTMPVFSNSTQPATNQAGISAGTAGVNALNLRGLGTGRSLILLDGQRSVGALLSGAVDVNNFPQQLVQRVDVVTGGASAVYGSDAIGGVANFILDKQFTGIKAEVSGGVTSYGDGQNYKIGISGGFGFGGGRGHVLLSGEQVDKDEIRESLNRGWDQQGWGIINNPAYTATNGQPARLILSRVGISNATHGGIIVSGPLKGTAFGPGGVPYQFNYGDLVVDPKMHNGDWRSTLVHLDRGNALDPGEHRQNAYSRISYDVTDNINVFFSSSWARVENFDQAFTQFQEGNAGTIKADNAFIPADVRARMTALGLTQFAMGSMHYDLPSMGANSERFTVRNVVGANGKFDALETGWSWDVYYQNGRNRNSVRAYGDVSVSKYRLAIDAVRDAGGRIVCRTKLTNPTSGCQPWNIMGEGVNNQAGLDYLVGDSYLYQVLEQNVWAGSVTGEPFSVPAGPVSVAFSAEHRIEQTKGIADAQSLATDWFTGNYKPIIGKYNVSEAAVETIVPLAKGEAWADAWEVTGAARATDYSTSGFVVTWKVGTTYSPVPDVKFRLTRSRDIRAGNLQELYAVGTSSQNNVADPFCEVGPKQLFVTGTTTPVPCNPLSRGLAVGNASVKPEKADTTGIGVVLQPTFLPGFSMSADYWHVDIKDGIAAVGTAATVNLCFNGNQAYCPNITRTNNIITEIKTFPVNIASQVTSGVDLEASYRMPMSDFSEDWDGGLSLHANMTINLKDDNFSGLPGAVKTTTVGSTTTAHWRLNASLTYDNDPLRISLSTRVRPPGEQFPNGIGCASGCPTSTADRLTYNINHLDGAFYLDSSISYKFGLGEDMEGEAFLNIRNLMNRDPGIVPVQNAYYYTHQSTAGAYDTLGRNFRAGLRFRM